jgi:hypothetical protein
METRIIELPPLVLSPNNFYLYYTEDGDIISLTNEKMTEGNYIQVSEKFVIDFLESKKEIRNFKVKISDQVRLEQKISDIKNNYDYYIIPYSTNAKLTVNVHNTNLKFKLNNFEKTFVVNDKRTYSFAIFDQRNLNFVKKVAKFTLNELLKGVKVDYRFDVKKELVATLKEFDSYGLVYDKKN